MNKMFRNLSMAVAVFAGLFALAGAAFSQTVYDIDAAHSAARFSVRHMMVSNVRGEFAKLSGSVVYDPAKPDATTIDATIDAASINTNNEKRDAHLKSPDFFDAAKFPTLTFKSKRAWKADGVLQVEGSLTMHGVTRDVVLLMEGPTPEQKDPAGNTRIGATATTKVNRKDYGLAWNKVLESGGVVVGEEVAITIDVEAVKHKTAAK
jgi:polyisoprenoid-binding protein YceI